MTRSQPPLIGRATLADQVYDYLSGQISAGTYPPGTLLRELDLVEQLKVSRTPIREALMRLAEHGLVSMEGRSAQVRQITRDEVKHIFQVRIVLEVTAAGLACGRLTDDDFAELDRLTPTDLDTVDEPTSARLDRFLHHLIALRSGNPVLQRKIRRLIDLIQLAHKQLAGSRRWLRREVEEHTAIIKALRSGDRKRCRQAMRAHLLSAYRNNVRCAEPAAVPEPT